MNAYKLGRPIKNLPKTARHGGALQGEKTYDRILDLAEKDDWLPVTVSNGSTAKKMSPSIRVAAHREGVKLAIRTDAKNPKRMYVRRV